MLSALEQLKLQAEECFQLRNSDRDPEVSIKEQLEEGKCGALFVDLV